MKRQKQPSNAIIDAGPVDARDLLRRELTPAQSALALEGACCVALLALFAVLKLNYNPPLGDSLDGSYYVNIARHVARGQGLVSSLSIFHMGLEQLPDQTVTYPLFPLLLGWSARLMGLSRATVLVPELLYGLSLVLCYWWLRRTARLSVGGRRWFAPVAAGALTALLGLNPIYHWASSRAYTEPLGFALTFTTLLAYSRVREGTKSGLFWRFVVGVVAGVCYLARFQLLFVSIALIFVEALARDRGRFQRVAALAAGAVIPIGLWVWRCASIPNALGRSLFDYAKYQQLSSLPPFVYTYDCGTAWHCTLEKLQGLVESLRYGGKVSYVAQFDVATYLVPFALIALVLKGFGHKEIGWLRRARSTTLLASALIGLISVLPIHLVHSRRWVEWSFGWRHGLPLFFLLAPVSLWLLGGFRWKKSRRLGMVCSLVTALALAGALIGISRKTLAVKEIHIPVEILRAREAVARYLEENALQERTLAIEPQSIAAFTDAPLDWVACWSVPELAEELLNARPITRAVFLNHELACPSLSKIRSRLRLDAVIGQDVEYGVFRIVR